MLIPRPWVLIIGTWYNTLVMAHLKRIADCRCYLELIVRINGESVSELLGCTGKLREDQNARVCRILSRNIFFCNQVHAVPQRRDEPNTGEPIQAREHRPRIGIGRVVDGHPARFA
jgi:hypothetical protein